MKMPISLSVAGNKKKGVLAVKQNTVGVCELWEGSILQHRDSINGPLYKMLKIGWIGGTREETLYKIFASVTFGSRQADIP